MEQKKFIQVLKKVVKETVREVIKEELTEILQEGLQPTVNDLKTTNQIVKNTKPVKKHSMFKENKFSDILNQTGVTKETTTTSDYANLMNEDIVMTSNNAQNFGMQRSIQSNASPSVIDAETGQNIPVQDTAVANAMTRDYSALMKAIDKKKNR
jgi:hypothetical protein